MDKCADLVLVEWVDSFGCEADWKVIEGPAPEALICRSVGWLLHDDDKCLTIVPHLSTPHTKAEPQGCGDMTIPKVAVVRMFVLHDPTRSDSNSEETK